MQPISYFICLCRLLLVFHAPSRVGLLMSFLLRIRFFSSTCFLSTLFIIILFAQHFYFSSAHPKHINIFILFISFWLVIFFEKKGKVYFKQRKIEIIFIFVWLHNLFYSVFLHLYHFGGVSCSLSHKYVVVCNVRVSSFFVCV